MSSFEEMVNVVLVVSMGFLILETILEPGSGQANDFFHGTCFVDKDSVSFVSDTFKESCQTFSNKLERISSFEVDELVIRASIVARVQYCDSHIV